MQDLVLLSMFAEQGEANSFDYRVFVEEKGQKISLWHDIPLYAEDGLVNFIVEIPKETSAKMESATVSTCFSLIMAIQSHLLSQSSLEKRPDHGLAGARLS